MALPRHTFGFITLESVSPYTTQLWLGANDCATQLDINLITFGGHEPLDPNQALPDWFFKQVDHMVDLRSLDGILIWTAGILKDHALADQLLVRYRGLPTVSLGVDTPGAYRAVSYTHLTLPTNREV